MKKKILMTPPHWSRDTSMIMALTRKAKVDLIDQKPYDCSVLYKKNDALHSYSVMAFTRVFIKTLEDSCFTDVLFYVTIIFHLIINPNYLYSVILKLNRCITKQIFIKIDRYRN